MRPELTAWFNKFMYFYDRGYKRSILLRKNHTQLKSCVVVDLDKSHASFRRKTWIQAGKVDMRSSSYGTWHLINYYLVDRRMKYTDIRICRNHMGIKIYWLYSSLYPHAHNLSVHDMNFLRFTSESQTTCRTDLRLRLRKADLTQSGS